jgi:hypothetical protein
MTATGGTISCCGDYKIHTFTSDGTFTVTSSAPILQTIISFIYSSRWWRWRFSYNAGGGGAGGYRE